MPLNTTGLDSKQKPQVKITGQYTLFRCKNHLCEEVFWTYKDLEKHLISEACLAHRKQQELICDYMKKQYASMFTASKSDEIYSRKERRSLFTHFEDLKHEVPAEHLTRDETFQYTQDFKMGFALKVRKKQTKYNPNQLEYLQKLFLEGQRGGKKFQAPEIVEMMKRATRPGKPDELRFEVSEWLTESQIRYQLAKMTIQLKNTGEIELEAQVDRAQLHEAVEEADAQTLQRDAENLHTEVSNLDFEVNENRPQSHPWIVSYS